MTQLVFQFCLLAVLVAALRYGGRPERLGACAYVVAALATELLRTADAWRYEHLQGGVFAVDLLLLAALLALSLRFDLWWPMCATALQLTTVLGHVAKILKPEIWPLAYAWMMQASSFPSLIVLMAGILASRSRRRTPGPSSG